MIGDYRLRLPICELPRKSAILILNPQSSINTIGNPQSEIINSLDSRSLVHSPNTDAP